VSWQRSHCCRDSIFHDHIVVTIPLSRFFHCCSPFFVMIPLLSRRFCTILMVFLLPT
jgi:hypothetical protein